MLEGSFTLFPDRSRRDRSAAQGQQSLCAPISSNSDLSDQKFWRPMRRGAMKPQISTFDRGPCLKRILATAVVSLSCLSAAVLLWQPSGFAHGQTRTSFWVRSASFSAGGSIPRNCTCDGADLSPQLQWQSAPAGAKSFAVVVDDPDAPIDFTHWLVFNIPPGVRELAEGASQQGAMPHG